MLAGHAGGEEAVGAADAGLPAMQPRRSAERRLSIERLGSNTGCRVFRRLRSSSSFARLCSSESVGRPTLDEHLDTSGFGGFQARLFALCCLTMVSHGAQMSVLTMLQRPVTDEFALEELEFSLLGSAIFGGMLVGSLAGGAAADFCGRRPAMLAASAVFCVFSLCSAAAPELFSFAAARVLTGLGGGALVPIAGSLLLEWSPTRWRSAMVMTMAGTAFAIGTLLESGAGLLLHEHLGEGRVWWRALLVVCSLPALLSLPVMLCTLPESVHFLMVHGRHAEAHALLLELQRVNGTELRSGGQITTRAYTESLTRHDAFDCKQLAEMFCAEVRGAWGGGRG